MVNNIYDLVYDGRGVIDYMNQMKPLPIEPTEVSNIDIIFNLTYGDMKLSPMCRKLFKDGVTNDNMSKLASILSTMFSQKWEKINTVIATDISGDSYNMKTTETITGLETGLINQSNDRLRSDNSKVSGYNSSIMIDDELKDTTDIENYITDDTRNKTINKVTETTGSKDNRVSDLNRTLNFMKTNLIQDLIFSDVSDIIGSRIY